MTTYPDAWTAVVDFLAAQGVRTLFGLPGDDLGALDALAGTDSRLVLCRDQRNAMFMAAGHAHASGGLGVCVVGKGPAVTNALTGLLEARAGAVPVLLLAAATSSANLGTGAFQELDQLAIARTVAKWAGRVETPNRLRAVLERAVLIALNGPPGPVYVEIPDDVAAAPVSIGTPWRPVSKQRPAPDPRVLAETLGALRGSAHPVLLAGGGARDLHRDGVVEALATRLGAAIFVTASGRGAVRESHPLFCGGSGLYAQPALAELWSATDLVVALGSRLEETATFGWDKILPADTPIVQVNLGEAEVATDRPGWWVLADVAATVRAWLDAPGWEPECPNQAWADRVAAARSTVDTQARARLDEMRRGDQVHVAEVLAALDAALPPDRLLVQENGLQDMWSYVYPYWRSSAGGALAPSEQTSLGFGMAAAAGAKLALPDRAVAALGGDGAFNLFRGDLVTVARTMVAAMWVVLDNGGYGWLQYQWNQRPSDQRQRAGTEYAFTTPLGSATGEIARQFGIWFRRVERRTDLDAAVRDACAECAQGRPAVLEVAVSLADVPPGFEVLDGEFPAA